MRRLAGSLACALATLAQATEAPLRWENIERSLAGQALYYEWSRAEHRLVLEPAAWSLLELPGQHALRLEARQAEGGLDALEIQVGDGGGLFAPVDTALLGEHQVLLADTRYRQVRLQNTGDQSLHLRLHAGEISTLDEPQRQLPPPHGSVGSLVEADRESPVSLLGPERDVTFRVVPDLPLAIEVRPLARAKPLVPSIELDLIGGDESSVRLLRQTDATRLLRDDRRCWNFADRTYRGVVVPTTDRLTVKANEPMTTQLMRAGDAWRWSANRADGAGIASAAEQLESRLLDAAKQVGFGGALQAVAGDLDPIADAAEWARLWRRYSVWRSAGVVGGDEAIEVHTTRARQLSWPAALRGTRQPLTSLTVAAEQLRRTPLVEWVRLRPGQRLDYALAPREVPSQLQLWLQTDGLEQATQLAVSYDDSWPRWVDYQPAAITAANQFDPAALVWGQAHPASWPDPWSVVSAITAELDLPIGPRKVSVQLPDGAAPVWIGLRYRMPRETRFDEPAALAQLSNPDSLWRTLTDALDGRGKPPAVLRGLLRLLSARAERSTASEIDQAVSADWLGLAEQADAIGDRRLARQLRQLLVSHGEPATRAAAIRALANEQAQQTDPLQRQMQAAWRIVHDADRSQLLPLAQALADEGDVDLAVLAALAAASSEQRKQQLAAYARQLNWAQLGQRLNVAEQPAQVTSWQRVPANGVDAAGRVLLQSPSRDSYFRMWRVGSRQPLRWRLVEAGQYRLTVRSLGSDKATQIALRFGQQQHTLRLTARAHSALRLVGEALAVGTRDVIAFDLLDGGGVLALAPDQGEVLVTLERRQTGPIDQAFPATLTQQGDFTRVNRVDDCQVTSASGAPGFPGATDNQGTPGRLVLRTGRAAGESRWSGLRRDWTAQTADRPRLWSEALALAVTDPALRAELSALTPGRWQRLDQVVASAGLIREPVTGWQSESPRLQLRKALLDVPAQSWLLANRRTEALALDLAKPTALRLRLSMRHLPTTAGQPVSVRLNAAGRSQTIELLPDTDRSLQLTLPAGRQELALTRDDHTEQHYVLVQVSRRVGNRWRVIEREFERTYQVSTREQPLVLNLPEPAWLRINRWDGQQHQVDYQVVERAGPVTLAPEPGVDEAWLRVFRFEPQWQSNEIAAPEPQPEPVAASESATVALPMALRLQELIAPLSGAEDGTWSFGVAWRQRLELDAAEADGGEEFTEINWNYRSRANRSWWWQSELLAREHRTGEPTLGMRHWLAWQPPRSPWSAQLQLGAWRQQMPDGRDADSWALNAGVDYETHDGEFLSRRTRFALFGRQLDRVARSQTEFAEIDQDVASRYKLIHRYGWDLGHRLTWRQSADSHWWLEGRVRGNELGQPWLDQVGVDLAWRNYIDGWTVDLGLRNRWFANDDDRSRSSNAQRVFVEASWLDFPATRWGWRARVGVVHDLAADESSVRVNFDWLADSGRGVRDFRPRALAFRGLHQRRADRQPARADGNRLVIAGTPDG